MSGKKSESTLPSELNENWGSNYMMDGFWHDMEYGHGLKENPPADPIPQPATSGMAQLPDGMIMGTEFENVMEGVEQEQEGAMDLEALGIIAKTSPKVDRSDVGVIDLSWIGEAYQDPARLPNMPVDNGIPELQEAWGDRTDGIQRIDLYDRGAVSYEDALQHEEDDDPLNRDKLASLVRAAMRRSAAGVPIDTIRRDLVDQLGPERGRKIIGPVRAIGAEHGLVGNVYVRASAYPGLHLGKWADAFKKAAKGARYLVGCSGEDCEGCSCATGLTLVAHPDEIDWNDAYAHYAPQLEATGRLDRMATVMDKRESLRQAFLQKGKAPRTGVEPSRLKVTMPVDGVTAAEAVKTVADFKAPHREVLSLRNRHDHEAREKVGQKLGQMVKAHLLTEAEATALCGSSASPHAILKAAAQIALTVKTARYSGGEPAVRGETISKQAAWKGLREAEAKTQADVEMRRRVVAGALHQKVRMIQAQVNGGLKGRKLGTLIRETLTQAEAVAASGVLGPFLKKTGALNPRAPATKKYRDAKFTHHVASAPEIGVSAPEIHKAARWVRQQMTEGFAGPELDTLIQLRLTPKVAAAAGSRIASERKEHEGLAGHVYVDAAAYASVEGVTGCDDGALKHRANGLKFVRAMDRCDGCVYKNADGVCQKYNKTLLDEIPADFAKMARAKHLATHHMSDQEQTAAMFSIGMDAASAADLFQLHNGALDDVETEAPDHQILDGIFFGGFEI